MSYYPVSYCLASPECNSAAGLQQGQQQMGPAYAYHYGSMFYPMYPVPGFSAPSVSYGEWFGVPNRQHSPFLQ